MVCQKYFLSYICNFAHIVLFFLSIGLFPTYFLHMEREDGKKVFLLAGRKRKKSATSNYLMTTDPTDLSRGGDSFVGKLRSNVMGTQFTIFDSGEPLKSRSLLQVKIRKKLSIVVLYNFILLFEIMWIVTIILYIHSYCTNVVLIITKKDIGPPVH